jgi:hypothetical protein
MGFEVRVDAVPFKIPAARGGSKGKRPRAMLAGNVEKARRKWGGLK